MLRGSLSVIATGFDSRRALSPDIERAAGLSRVIPDEEIGATGQAIAIASAFPASPMD